MGSGRHERPAREARTGLGRAMRLSAPAFLLLLLALVPFVLFLAWPAGGRLRRREKLSLAFRLLMLLSIVLSLARLESLRTSDALAVVYLLDQSDSMSPSSKAAALEYVRSGLAHMGAEDSAGVVVFGKEALVERPLSHAASFESISSVLDTTQTDLAQAIHLAMALFPPGVAKRIVILSDGRTSAGDELAALRLAAGSGVEIMGVAFEEPLAAEVIVSDLRAPARLRAGERFDLELALTSTGQTAAQVSVWLDAQIVERMLIDVTPGRQEFKIPLVAGEPGFARYEVRIEPQADTYYQNNLSAAFSSVSGPPKVLLIAPSEGEDLPGSSEARPDEFSALAGALRSAGLDVELALPQRMPSDLLKLSEYAGLVMVDVPARTLSPRQLNALQAYVRDLGGGLVVVGGPTSYGVGGYYGTPLEETLPVDMQITAEERRVSLALVFVIDRSGSMSEASGGAPKIELAKEAAIRSTELLAAHDRVGVVVFDESASWAAPIAELADPRAVREAIGSIRAGGGTDILAGLQAVARELPSDPARVKHIILLTDGGASPEGIPELVSRLFSESGITLSVVGVGQDAASFLEGLAAIGGGRYHYTEDPATIPSIFTEETAILTRAYLVEERFQPVEIGSPSVLAGLPDLPPLEGYVATSLKQTATVLLETHQGDPLLAAWQNGLGRAIAFTSDASGRWAKEWIAWGGFAQFWGQVVGASLGEGPASPLAIELAPDGDQVRLAIDAQTEDGLFLNGYMLRATVVDPGGIARSFSVPQIAPGRYEANIDAGEQGVYLISVLGEKQPSPTDVGIPADRAVSARTGWVLSYSPEYRELGAQDAALERLMGVSGGRMLTADPGQPFERPIVAARTSRPAWPWLLLLALLLLPLDIGVRRLTASPMTLLSEALRGIHRRPRTAPSVAPQVEALRIAKSRLRFGETTGPVRHDAGSPDEVGTPGGVPGMRESMPSQKIAHPPPVSPPAPPERAATTAEHLLARKRSRRGREQ